jgi:hypothetical protein
MHIILNDTLVCGTTRYREVVLTPSRRCQSFASASHQSATPNREVGLRTLKCMRYDAEHECN